MLLRTLNLERIFKAVRSKGFEQCELYAELGTHTYLTTHQKIDALRCVRTGGVGIRLAAGLDSLSLSCTQITTNAVIQAIEGTQSTVTSESPGGLTSAAPPLLLDSDKHFQLAKNAARQLLSRCPNEKSAVFEFFEQRRDFEIAHSTGETAEGHEEMARISLRGLDPSTDDAASVEIARTSVERLFNEMESFETLESWAAPFRRPLPATWPAPRGEFDLVLSPTAFSKITLRLLQAFEGDRFLGNESFLSENPGPIPFRFRLEEEIWPDQTRGVDHEGSPRKSFTFFEGGRPKGLACNRWVADQLDVSSTGHCRRESYRAPPTVGFWSAGIRGEVTKLDLREGLAAGIYINDVEILSYQPATAQIELRIHRAHLIHHGELGEPIEPVTIKMSLPQLLSRCDEFTARRETFGFPIYKHAQNFVTEVHAPAALARAVYLPGTVPPHHYW